MEKKDKIAIFNEHNTDADQYTTKLNSYGHQGNEQITKIVVVT